MRLGLEGIPEKQDEIDLTFGNPRTDLLVAGGAALEAEARSILAAMRGRPYVFNLGHGIVPQTPPDHVTALMRILRSA